MGKRWVPFFPPSLRVILGDRKISVKNKSLCGGANCSGWKRHSCGDVHAIFLQEWIQGDCYSSGSSDLPPQ